MTKDDKGKVVAIVSYITLIGWVIALLLYLNENKPKLGGFHLRQSLLLFLVGIALSLIPILGWILSIVVFVFWIMGLVYAIKGEEKELPLIGKYSQEWFHMI